MKKFLSIGLALVMIFAMMSTAFATENYPSNLNEIAQSTIAFSQTTQDSGAVVSTYENLDIFISEARNQNPSLSDYDLARFIIDYTGQDSTGVPEVEALMMLEYDNINVSTSYAKVTEEGSFIEISEQEALLAPLDIWSSPDGYMRLNTNFSKISTSGTTKAFNVWTYASWLKYPSICIEDALMVGTNGSFDDSYEEFAYVYQTFTCNSCGRETKYNRKVDKNNASDFDLALEYTSGGVPAIRFAPLSPRCDYCSGGAKDTYFMACIRYGVLVEGSGIIQASYGHKTFGLSGISIGVDATGMPSLSVGVGSLLTTYNARPVTLK